MDLGLAGSTVFVQGGTRGMGLAAAEYFARDGAKVALMARTRSDLERVGHLLRKTGSPDVLCLPGDITAPDDVHAAFARVEERWGALNVLVNTSGPEVVGGFETLTDAEWLAAIDQGALGMVRCVRAALPLLRAAEWARIVNVSAHSTKRQTPSLVAYTAAKSVVTSVTKNLSMSLAGDEILVNTVSPGSIATPALKAWAESAGFDSNDPYAIMTGIAQHFGHPAHLPRAGSAEEVGAVIAFLASKANSYMTGANVNVDGGSDFT